MTFEFHGPHVKAREQCQDYTEGWFGEDRRGHHAILDPLSFDQMVKEHQKGAPDRITYGGQFGQFMFQHGEL